MSRILIVDDEERIGLLLSETLADCGHQTSYLTDGARAIERISKGSYDLVITDLRMEPVDGMAVVRAVRNLGGATDVAVLTAHGSTATAVTAMKAGAIDYLQKPLDLDEMALWVKRWEDNRRLGERKLQLEEDIASLVEDEFIGDCEPVRALRSLIERVARTNTTVLITGESGSGKELVARAIHRASSRRDGPFIATNCAALAETLLESELFGHERGAFTGAVKQRAGRFELAEGGTLFLDEIGETSPNFQAKLLRVLEQHEIVRVGATESIAVNARVVTATNKNLEDLVAQNRFREDLYFRVNVFPILVPPLRERLDDIPLLTSYFLKKFRYAHADLSAEVIEQLQRYDWPGNIRELRNLLERATILAAGDPIAADDLGTLPAGGSTINRFRHSSITQQQTPSVADQSATFRTTIDGGLEETERRMIADALRTAGGNKSKAARALKITRRVLYAKLRKYGLDQE